MSTFPSVADTGKPTSSSLRACENTMLRPLKSAPAREKSAATTGSTSLIRRPKRQVTRIACQSCRERKSKCDGERPTCGACRAKDLICTYKVGRGVSRATDMKLRNARLQKDLGSMLELYWYIQSTSPSKANEIIDKIRAGAEPVTVFGMLSGHSESTLTVDAGSTSSSTADPEAAQARDGLSTASTVDVELLGFELAQSGALAGLDGSECQDLLELEREDEDEDVILGQEDDLAVNFLQTPEATKVLRSAVQTFLICTGSLFHVFSAEEVDELFVTAFGTNQEQRDLLALISTQDDNSLRKAVMCSLFAMAAVGLQYTREPVRAIGVDDTAEADSKGIHTDSFYQLSRYLLDDAIRTNIPLAIKSLTVLTIYNIITHSTVALAYANMGLSLARNQGYAANQLSIVARQHVWEDCKRVIRTLISLKSWLVATLGYVPNSMDHDYHNYILQDIEVAPEDLIHQELVKVTIIKAGIIRMMDSYMQLQPSNLQKIRTDLTRWHEELPEWMRLSSLIRDCNLPPTMKRVVLFVHLFYLSAINLVSRIVHGSELKLGRALAHDDIRIAVSEGLIASRVSAGILGLMLAEDSLFKKCWLCIFQSYMSCLTILYGATRKIASGYTRSDWQQELSAAETCINVLEFCASTDHIAREFVQTTRIFYDRVDSIDKEQSPLWTESTAPGYATQGNTQETAESTDYLFSGPCETRPDVEELSNQLRLVIGQPFTGSLSQQSCDLFPIIEQMDTLTSIEEISIGAHLEWSLQAKCLCTPPSSKGKAKETSQREALLKSLAGVGAGRFIDSARPSGWSVWT